MEKGLDINVSKEDIKFYPQYCARPKCSRAWIGKVIKETCPWCGKIDMVCTVVRDK